MTWFPVDDKAYADERFRRLGPGGCSLYAFAGSFCMDHLTDGFVPDWFVNEWPGGRKAAPKLVAEGIWTKVHGGHQFIEWPEFCTRKKVEAKRRKWRRNKIREGSGSTVESTLETEDFHGGIHGSPSNPGNPSNPDQPLRGLVATYVSRVRHQGTVSARRSRSTAAAPMSPSTPPSRNPRFAATPIRCTTDERRPLRLPSRARGLRRLPVPSRLPLRVLPKHGRRLAPPTPQVPSVRHPPRTPNQMIETNDEQSEFDALSLSVGLELLEVCRLMHRGNWARTLFHRVGRSRAPAIHRALSRVLHPDNQDTGCPTLQRELNDARAELEGGGR